MIFLAVLAIAALYLTIRVGFALLRLTLAVLGLIARILLALLAPRRRMVR